MRLRANPRDCGSRATRAVGAAHGVNVRKPSGSHVVFEHPAVAEAVSVPARRPIKAVYVLRFVQLIDAVRTSYE
jgi:hypothetical protein